MQTCADACWNWRRNGDGLTFSSCLFSCAVRDWWPITSGRVYREEGLSLRLRPSKNGQSVLWAWQTSTFRTRRAMGHGFCQRCQASGWHIRILTIRDLWDRSSPALEVDISLSGLRVVQVLERFVSKDAFRVSYGLTTARSL